MKNKQPKYITDWITKNIFNIHEYSYSGSDVIYENLLEDLTITCQNRKKGINFTQTRNGSVINIILTVRSIKKSYGILTTRKVKLMIYKHRRSISI